jgi:hypothetical protein
MEDDAWTDIGSAAARVVMGVARPGVTPAQPNISVFGCPSLRGGNSTARHSGTAAGTERDVLAAREDTTSAALAGTGEARRAHNSGGGTAVVLEFRRRGTGATGPTWPPRPTINTVSDGGVAPSRITPATGGLGNARMREGR